jgi:folate-dependent tRNA-U54 methylase TrmFO/GidA
LANSEPKGFAPVNAMIGLLPELPKDELDKGLQKKNRAQGCSKTAKRMAMRERALTSMQEFIARLAE